MSTNQQVRLRLTTARPENRRPFANCLNHLSFRSQITLALLMLAVLTVLLMSIVAYTQSIKVLRHNFLVNTGQTFQRTRNDLLTKFNTIENTLKLISTDQRLQSINRPGPPVSNRELAKFFMDCINLNNYQESLAHQHLIKNLIDELIFCNEQRIILSRREHFTVYGIEAYLPPSLLAQARAAAGKLVWSKIFFNHPGSRLNPSLPAATLNKELNQLALVKYVTHEKFKTPLGYLVASINLARLSDLVDGITLGKSGRVYISDANGQIIAGRDQQLILQPLPLNHNYLKLLRQPGDVTLETRFNHVSSFIYSVDIGVNGWKLIGVIATQEFREQAAVVRNRLLIGGFGCLFIFGVGAAFLARRVTRPILNICNFLQQVAAGNLSLRTSESGSVEIEKLSANLNRMIESMGQLLEENYQEQLFKRKAALKALHAQINPHFLYNTLESISWMIESGRREVANGLINSLATFFRSGLSGGREVITLREELQHAQSYLEIQKIRYQNQLDYLFDIDDSILDAPIVKITLQPLIENAIYHGVKPKTGAPGVICLTGTLLNEQTIRLTVVDNGVGMSEIQLQELNAVLAEPKLDVETEGRGYSLPNINSRIKLYFGREFGLRYFAKPGVGTRAEVLLPLKKQA